jgi:ubiquinone/menaquinone biosynthesis C-methylase UbiE
MAIGFLANYKIFLLGINATFLQNNFRKGVALREQLLGVSMAKFSTERDRVFYAETYDTIVPDWPGEIDLYRELAAEANSKGQAVLEIACGTGRVAIRLAQDGIDVVGLDLSPAMLSVARDKSIGISNIRWVQGDMRSFELGGPFGLAIIPGHSFQNILTVEDQVASLESIKRHLVPGGILVIHLDHVSVSWLGELTEDQGGVFKAAGSFTHPRTGQQIRTFQAWSYEPVTQTAISQKVWEAINSTGEVIDRWESGPLRFHCVFRFEMEHLLERTGFIVESVYGNFFREELQDSSPEMVWVASNGYSQL